MRGFEKNKGCGSSFKTRKGVKESHVVNTQKRSNSKTYQDDSSYKDHISEKNARRVKPRRICLQSAAIGIHYRHVSAEVG